MNSAAPRSRRSPTPTLGRPRRLTVEQIVKAAQDLGPQGLTMSAVAKQLGVSVTVLYGYVASRAELVRLVTAGVTQERAVVRDEGQSWSIYIAQSAAALYAIFTGPGQLLQYFLNGGLGPEIELDRSEAWLEKLTACGFTVDEALTLQRRMGEIVIGGAVTALHSQALEQAGRPFAQAASEAIRARSGAVPLLAAAQERFAAREAVWGQSILEMLELIEVQRGEALERDVLEAILTS